MEVGTEVHSCVIISVGKQEEYQLGDSLGAYGGARIGSYNGNNMGMDMASLRDIHWGSHWGYKLEWK